MSPPTADVDLQQTVVPIPASKASGAIRSSSSSSSQLEGPLAYTGQLDQYEHFDVTSAIGREFPTLQLTDILDDDAKIRDLAVLVSQRGVVFFRRQDIGIDDQKRLGQRLGELTGKPATSRLHRHALSNSKRGIAVDENGRLDDEISIISSEQNRLIYRDRFGSSSRRLAGVGWHADITFENIPSDYAILKIVQPPEDVGGDTLWASGYELYDRLSPPIQKLTEGLTATHHQPAFVKAKDTFGIELISEDRGAPENNGLDFKAEHPLIRTNPVTGWKSLFGAGHQVDAGWINGVSERESDILKAYFLQLITENHDLQVRFRWNKNDVAIWDNRSVFHTATNDYIGKRQGNRVVSLGEKPYYDPNSKSRREALGLEE
ncbi:alpha-ketoglutarate-dependent sulfonate dioxygenase [Grosmannia clavigera kw1407]|uniref:Alpha-ketoglutarate-dependent sulfonate dioxygenase n=1 Tax=Grosmannia clavigera (strain kw1407 / UAMH 11150) TaxID=655863 RepID=F0XKU8_GROCL|nr:alpha-ketoglutarate-dependent sulfonate dioxygenase [Grosmannia clavigera kw1407]EFX01815.1 alpha-ketoglutarate-dependent sulfonate dioxygenase [Grosmannia clavigera kw1407]